MSWRKIKQMMISDKMHVNLTIGIFITLLGSIIYGTYRFTTEFNYIKNDIHGNKELVIYTKDDLDQAVADIKVNRIAIQLQEVKQAEINTKLANIETRQIEQLQIIKEIYQASLSD